ncbi:MAG UNVERIFIED_CONTAM: hypothetical protein LVT10_15205 [Anaerolineae bacterium]
MIAEESSAQFLSGLQPHQRQRVVTLVSETLRESVTEAEVIGVDGLWAQPRYLAQMGD